MANTTQRVAQLLHKHLVFTLLVELLGACAERGGDTIDEEIPRLLNDSTNSLRRHFLH